MLRSHRLHFMSKNYKETLNLPRTEFPMKANLAAREPEILRAWEETRLYQQIQKSREGRELFVLHDGPPFANGDVHMGTALNKIRKDFVVKSQTMLGKRAPYVPGWDCHGLPIEYKVVKESRALSPLEVRKKSEAFARKFINIQRGQFKRLGVFGDWENPYLTMDPKYEAEILRAFAVFVEEGLVYQSKNRARRGRSRISGARRHQRLRQVSDHEWRLERQGEHCYLDYDTVDIAGEPGYRCRS
jgi:isoleucyl-tRNA synthetase